MGDADTYIALGSNVGDRIGYLRRALDFVNALQDTRVIRLAALYETEPVGGPADQGRFLNSVAALRTELSPTVLLKCMLDIESSLDRVREVKDGPRTIDLDLIMHGQLVHDDEFLTLPHPRMHERSFVLIPMCDLNPKLIHPTLNRSMEALLTELPHQDGVTRIDGPSWWSPSDNDA